MDLKFRNCTKVGTCIKPECKSTHNVLLHGADLNFLLRKEEKISSTGKFRRKNQPCLAPRQCSLLKVFSRLLSVLSKSKTDNALVLGDSASNHSWLSAGLARRLNLSGRKVDLNLLVQRISFRPS